MRTNPIVVWAEATDIVFEQAEVGIEPRVPSCAPVIVLRSVIRWPPTATTTSGGIGA